MSGAMMMDRTAMGMPGMAGPGMATPGMGAPTGMPTGTNFMMVQGERLTPRSVVTRIAGTMLRKTVGGKE